MTDNLSAEYWNNRYINNDFGWDIGTISSPLKAYIDQLNNKNLNILIPGAGNSYEAEYLHQNGFKNVMVLDFAAEPLHNVKQRVPGFPAQHLVQQDFFEHTGQYDLVVEQTFFCALNPELRRNYVRQMHNLLKPGGQLAGVLFNDPLNADKPPFGGNKAEYENLFSDLFEIKILAPCYNSIKPREGRELFMILIKK